MKKSTIIVFMIITILAVGGCTVEKKSSENSNTENVIHTELDILSKLISLPKQPLSVLWFTKQNSKSKSSERLLPVNFNEGSLEALLKFNKNDFDFIVNNSESYENTESNAKISAKIFDKLLPSAAKEGITAKPWAENSYELIGVFDKQPNLFVNIKSSAFVNGSITPLSNGYILVSLYSM